MIYSKNDIQDFYTKVLNSYLTKGYMVNIRSMRGSQGEDAKIDLVKDGQVVRIILNTVYDIDLGEYYTVKALGFKDNGSDIYWSFRGDTLEEYYFIRTKDRRNYQMADEEEVNRLKLRLN